MIVDAHLDLSYNAVLRGRDVTQPASEQPIADKEIATVGLPDLRAGGVGLICATIFASPKKYEKKEGYETAEEARAQALAQLHWYQSQWTAGELRLVKSGGELPRDRARAIPMILLLEGADAFRSPEDVAWWHEQGLRIVGLSWRGTRMAGGTGVPGPITAEGRAVVRSMDQLKMIHDISHLADEAFWNLMEMTTGPVMGSHSNCRVIVPNDRQITDEMIHEIARRGGVIGLNFYDQFLMPPEEYRKRPCRLSDVIAHIKRICDLTGSANHVALGTDMDGGVGRDDIPNEIRTSADLPKVGEALTSAGFNNDDVTRILGGNWLRFFRRTLI
jgi:membrane dipeptidase